MTSHHIYIKTLFVIICAGYTFDNISSCSCVLSYSQASEGHISAIIVLCVAVGGLVVGGLAMASQKTGTTTSSTNRVRLFTRQSIMEYQRE